LIGSLITGAAVFMCKFHPLIQNELVVRGVSFDIISDAEANQILTEIASPALNYDIMKLEKYPKVAVYSPKSKQPWDDAVTLVLTYAEIPLRPSYSMTKL